MKITALSAKELGSVEISAWSRLQAASPEFSNPLFCPEFTLTTAEVRNDVEVAVMEEGGKLVGFFPFQRERQIVGHPVASVLSDMHGVIASTDVDWHPVELLRGCGLQCWHFDHLVAAQAAFRPFHRCLDDSPYMDLRGGFEHYVSERQRAGSSMITQARRKARKLEREVGPLRFQLHVDDPEVFATLIDWKRAQLARQGFADTFQAAWTVDLLDVMRNTQTGRFRGLLSALYAGDVLIAVHMGLHSGAVISSWIPTYDPEYAKYSPGLLLHLELARTAAAENVTRIDLGRGENQMKTSLMSGAFPVALGSVDRRLLHRTMTTVWYGMRRLAHSTPLRGRPLETVRRLRNAITSNHRREAQL
jgi:CelD/BcsL family acetyltransferase involved in cellulose biosynthesis